MSTALWPNCLQRLEQVLSDQQLNTWIRPLQVREDHQHITLFAPNRFVLDWVKKNFQQQISDILSEICAHDNIRLSLEVGSQDKPSDSPDIPPPEPSKAFNLNSSRVHAPDTKIEHNLNAAFTFDSFVEGKSNQLARAASIQAAENPGKAYNPLFLYGGVGLGKTHLMHALGNTMLQNHPNARVVYLHSERFVGNMVKSLQHNTIDAFKQHYRSLDALLIDDIQFFAGKERSQEEFFHTFNALLESGRQIVLTCDRYPKEVDGLEERLRSRFGWGLPVCIDSAKKGRRIIYRISQRSRLFHRQAYSLKHP